MTCAACRAPGTSHTNSLDETRFQTEFNQKEIRATRQTALRKLLAHFSSRVAMRLASLRRRTGARSCCGADRLGCFAAIDFVGNDRRGAPPASRGTRHNRMPCRPTGAKASAKARLALAAA